MTAVEYRKIRSLLAGVTILVGTPPDLYAVRRLCLQRTGFHYGDIDRRARQVAGSGRWHGVHGYTVDASEKTISGSTRQLPVLCGLNAFALFA